MPPSKRQIAVLAGLALGLAGCQDPYQREQNRPSAEHSAHRVQGRTAPGDVHRAGAPAPPVPAEPVPPGSAERTVLAAFARTWSNWDWRSVAAQQRALARLAAGSLAVQLRAGARATAADESLARDRPGASGSVVAIDLRPTRPGAAGVVVTREQTYTDGHADLGGRRYRVYLVTVERRGDRWRITRWDPQP